MPRKPQLELRVRFQTLHLEETLKIRDKKRFEGRTVRDLENRTYEKRTEEQDLFSLEKNEEGNITKFLN